MSRTAQTGPAAATQIWGGFLTAQRAALQAFAQGDPRPFQDLWSATPDATLLGAFGGGVVGWEAIRDRLRAAAGAYHDGVLERLDVISGHVLGDTAYTVHEEGIRFPSAAGLPMVRERRVTQIYRHTPAGWRIVHRHADPLLTTDIPAD